jgi:RNA 3'-terminal phosphate cyclase (ATP)
MIAIDGNYREGGGQILRTALGLSCLFMKPFRMVHIRKGRKKPGLMPQHLTAVKAAQRISGAEVSGANIGSTELVFVPGAIRGRALSLDIGTSGSVSLVLQTIMPALVFNKRKRTTPEQMTDRVHEENFTVTLQGGTHVPFSPSYHYLAEVFIPFLSRIGIEIKIAIKSFGFYPKGGGVITAEIYPASSIQPLHSTDRGKLLGLRIISAVGNLPLSIAERQKQALVRFIQEWGSEIICPIKAELLAVKTPSQGTFVFLKSESDTSIAGFTALGARGKRAEAVGEEAGREFMEYFMTGAALDPHMSDQIVLYLSLCERESVFTTSCVTDHLLTNLWTIEQFHEYRYDVEGKVGKPGMVRINF